MESKEIAEAIAKKLETAWNNASGKEFSEEFTTVSDFINVMGMHIREASKDEIGAGHDAIFNSIYKGSTLKYELIQASKIDTNTILAHVAAELNVPGGPMSGKHESRITMVIIPENNEWKVRAFHNTFVRER